jgi:hypothetical protein
MLGFIIFLILAPLLGITFKSFVNSALPGSFPKEEHRQFQECIQKRLDKQVAIKVKSLDEQYKIIKNTPQEIDWLMKNYPLYNYVDERLPDNVERNIRAKQIAYRHKEQENMDRLTVYNEEQGKSIPHCFRVDDIRYINS